MRIQLICRGSTEHGLGHLFRSKSLARHAASGHEVEILVLGEAQLNVLFQDISCSVRFCADDAELAPAVRAYIPYVVIFDLVAISPEAFGQIRSMGIPLACISPVFSEMQQLDYLFTRATAPDDLRGVTICSGLEYAIFNDFCHVISDEAHERSLRDPVLPIGLCMGGGDAGNNTLRVLQAVLATEVPCSIWVCLGDAYRHSLDELVASSRRFPRQEVIFARTNRSMWRVLENCACAILPGGLSTIEAIYAGLPAIRVMPTGSVSGSVAEKYDPTVTIDGGAVADGSVETLSGIVAELSADRDKLRAMRRDLRGLIDDRGSARVLAVLEQNLRGRPKRETPEPRKADAKH